MEGRSVSVTGLPTSINNVKLKSWIQKRIESPGCVETVKRSGDRVIFTFNNQEGYERFAQAEITEIEFGGELYPIKVFTPGFTEEIHPNPMSPKHGRMSPQSPEPKKTDEAPTTKVDQTQLVQKIQKFDEDLQKKLYRDQHSWSSLEHLPATGGTMCLLAQNIDPSTSVQKVVMHFESKKRSGGGSVAGIINMMDGLLVVFMESNDCLSSLKMANQKFEDKSLEIFPKKIPEYDCRKFVIEGVGPNTNEDTLIMFLECCSKNEVAPKSCVKQDLAGVYLAEYGEDFDTSETEAFLKKIKSRQLEDSHLQGKLLLKTDCLKVSGVTKDVSNDQIRFLLGNKKRSGGGRVTKVVRVQKNSALVYFSLYEDAERVYENSKTMPQSSIIIGQHPATVSLYYHSLAKDHENILQGFEPTPAPKSVPAKDGQKQQLQPYEFESKYDEKLLDFIFGRERHLEILNNVFEKFTAIELIKPDEEDKPRRLKFTPKKVTSNKSQEQFEKTCETSFEKHLARYSQSTERFDLSKLEKARSLKLYPQLEITYNGNENNNELEVSWKPNEPVVEAIGIKEAVDHMMQHITNCVNSSLLTQTFSESQFGVFIHCGIINDLREKYKSLQIRCDSNDFSVTYIGNESDVNQAQIDALSAMMIDKKKLSGVDKTVLKFLSESMLKSGEVTSKIQGKLKQNSVKAFILLDDGEPYLKAKTSENFRKAIEVISQYITVDNIKTDDAKVLKSKEWKDFQLSLGESGLCAVYINSDDSITLVGVLSETKIIRARIKSFLDENAIKRFFINAQYGKAKFVIDRSKEFSKEMCGKKEITCGFSPEANGGIFVEGKRKALDIAHPEMRKLLGSILEDALTLEKPGIKEYYSSKNGKLFLANTERACDCTILTEIRDNPEWVEYNKKHGFQARSKSKSTPVDLQEEKLSAVRLPNSSVTLTVWRTDISKHKCDAIVNASNEDLKLLPQGVSGIIKTYDDRNGKQIQTEMDDHIRKNNGKILPGEAVMTTAGNLPGCKRIVHACGPRWNSFSSFGRTDPRRILKACIARSLENLEDDHLKSIAIPAISCGVFGGKVPVCIPLIVEAVEEYFQEIGNSSIKEVHFVENSKQDVLDEFVKTLKKYEASMESSPARQKTPTKVISTPDPSGGAASSLLQGSCTVIMIHGDIADQKADVIVNVTDPRNLTNMMSGPIISKVLAAKAGTNVQQEVSRIPGPHNIGDVFETSGGGLACKKLYHALVTHYNVGQAQASGSVIQAVVSASLDMADKSGFKSIVFPAIATGGFRYPPDVVAKLMRQAIANFNGNSMREVIILLHPQNPGAIQAFDAEFKSGNPMDPTSPTAKKPISFTPHKYRESSSPRVTKRPKQPREKPKKKSGYSTFERIDESSASFGAVIASIQPGDITDQDCDVIVNSTNAEFDLRQGMVSKQIIKKGGRIIQDEATESGRRKKKDPDFVVTSGGKLHCQKIIHLVTPRDPKDLQKKILKVLNEVEKLKLNHVCMPAFGTGNLQMDVDTVGTIMQASIEQFVRSQRRLRNLEMVTIVIYEATILEKFIFGFFNPKKGLLERLFGWGGELFNALKFSSHEVEEEWVDEMDEFEHLPQSATSLNIFFYSTSKDSIQLAKDSISDEMNKVVHRAVIEDKSISRLTEWEKHDIVKSAEKHNVQITQKSSRYLDDRLLLDGLTQDVMKARDEIKDILREFSSAETCATYVMWQKKTAKNAWEDYHLRSSLLLEQAHKERTSGRGGYAPSQIKVQEFCDGEVTEHTVDLSLLDGNQQGKSPKVKRRVRERSVTDLPDYWDDMKDQQLMVSLQQGSQEYQNVLAKFQSGSKIFHQRIISIERVQNVSLYKQYAAKKAEVTEKLKNYPGQIERDLFHGTADDDKIVQNGFDRSYAGKNNILYGRGVYFATDPGFSHGYATANAQGVRKMFLANVITGEFCVGNQNMVAPPPRTNSTVKNDLFDSTVNNATNPTIFVIYKDASVYPTYLMTYT